MKKLVLVLVTLFLLVGIVVAQDATPKNKQGDMGIMFGFSGLSILGVDNYMSGVGIKYFIQDDLALRGGFGFATKSIPDVDENPMDFGLNAGVQYNFTSSGPVVGFFGGSLFFNSHKAQGIADPTNTFGLLALFGAEWFPWNSVSLGAEYGLGFSSSSVSGGDATTDINLTAANEGSFTITFYIK